MAFHDDRHDYEQEHPTRADRDEAEMQIAKVDELRTYLRDAVKNVVEELAGISMLNRECAPLGRATQEISVGAQDEVTGLFELLVSSRAYKEALALAEGTENVAG